MDTEILNSGSSGKWRSSGRWSTKDPNRLTFRKEEKHEATFQSRSFEFEGHFERLLQDKGEEYFRSARKKQETITAEAVENKIIEPGLRASMNKVLYSELRKVCKEGTPHLIVRKNNKDKAGTEAWRLMCDRCYPKGPPASASLGRNTQHTAVAEER